MKKIFHCLCVVGALLLTACTNSYDNDFDARMLPDGGGGTLSTTVSSTAELFTFDVSLNETFLSEAETIDPTDDDFIENTTFGTTVTITYSEGSVAWSALPAGVSAESTGAGLTIISSTDENIIYHLSGSASDGFFKLYTDKKCAIELGGVTLTNPTGPAINIQSKKRVFVALAASSTSTLADGEEYAVSDEDAKGVIFSEGQLIFSGAGRLTVTAIGKSGISSDQYLRFRQGNVIDVSATSGNAVRGKDSIIVSGGVMNISVSGQGNKGLKSDGPIRIAGGRTAIVSSASAYYDSDEADTKGAAGVNSEGDITLTGGELYVKASGTGGKGLTADGALTISGGTVRVITTGTKFSYGSTGGSFGGGGGFGGAFGGGGPNTSSSSDNSKSPKGIRSEGAMTISGGDIMCRTTGGSGSEGIESKATLTLAGGSVQAYAYDDAINSASAMYISSGDIWAVSSNNDGLDANGNMYISGGTITAFGIGEDGVDVIERGTLSITGGTLFSLGNTCMTTPNSVSTQPYIYKSNVAGLSSGTALTLTNSDGTTLFSYTMPLTFSRAYLILSLSTLSKGERYTLAIGTTTTEVTP